MKVYHGSITRLPYAVDAIVNAANGYVGVMGAGVARAIRDDGGMEIEAEARYLCGKQRHNEGTTYVTKAGSLKAKHIIHAVTMRYPGGRCGTDIVENCLKALFATAHQLGCKSIAIPGLGTRTGRAPLRDVASLFKSLIPQLEEQYGIEATVADIDRELISYLR